MAIIRHQWIRWCHIIPSQCISPLSGFPIIIHRVTEGNLPRVLIGSSVRIITQSGAALCTQQPVTSSVRTGLATAPRSPLARLGVPTGAVPAARRPPGARARRREGWGDTPASLASRAGVTRVTRRRHGPPVTRRATPRRPSGSRRGTVPRCRSGAPPDRAREDNSRPRGG